MTSWGLRNHKFRLRGWNYCAEDFYRLDTNKSHVEQAYEIFSELSSRLKNDARQLSLLNALVKLLDLTNGCNIGFTTEEFLLCVSASVVHKFTQIRAAALRATRHLLRAPKDLQIFNNLQLIHLVSRSIDIVVRNEEERIQALKLFRKMLYIGPDIICPGIIRSLISLGDGGVEDGDRMLRACLSALCEFGVLNPTLLIFCGGVSVITRNILECHSPRIAESLCGVLLHLLEWPQTRNIAGVNLECLAAPYCDFTYRLGIMDKNKDARDLRFTCSRLALLSVLRSWAGTIEFCDPRKISGLKAIVDVLYLNQLEVRKAILDLLYELLWLPQPVWTDEYSVALTAVDPADYQDAWRLAEGFVAMEGRSVLPSLANCVPNICEIHTALLLYCFLETGLLNALIEVIVSSDTFISVRATILIGKLLQLMHTHLPPDICSTSSALSSLVMHASQGNYQAKAAITALQSLNQMLKNRPASCSLFLDTIIQNGQIINSKIFKREIDSIDRLNSGGNTGMINNSNNSFMEKVRHDSVGSSGSTASGGAGTTATTGGGGGNDEPSILSTSVTGTLKRASIKRNLIQIFGNQKISERIMRDSNVLTNDDGKTWDWEVILAIIRINYTEKMDDTFIRRLVHYFKPSSNKFSHQDLGHIRHIPVFITCALELIDWLLRSPEIECIRFLTDLFSDIAGQLLAISTSKSAHDCLFSPQHMTSTMCQQYFLFIGRMCRTDKGLNILLNTDVFKQLENLVLFTNHICYIKLIISGFDYTLDGYPRRILEKALTQSKSSAGRLYATQFMLVLLRAKLPNVEVWGLPLLIKQTDDPERGVVLSALEILLEATHDKSYLEELVSLWPKFLTHGDQGKLVMVRFYSIPRGLNHHEARIEQEIQSWVKGYNKRYVLLIEAETHASLTLHTKNEDGTYSRRSCSSRPNVIPSNILPHLYGQLVQTSQGMLNLQKYGDLLNLMGILTQNKCNTEMECLQLKSAIWALAHASTSSEGVQFLNDPVNRVYEKIINLVKYCDVYSLRATALNALGLIGSTKAGANVLYKLDWMCVRHDRDTLWPITEPEDWLSKQMAPLRHQLTDMPPYNYTGIEENISGFGHDHHHQTAASDLANTTLTTDDSPSFYVDESCDSSKEDGKSMEMDESIKYTTKNINNNAAVAAVRSKTLPENVTLSKGGKFIKHTRSLSESKTADGLTTISTGSQIPNPLNSTTHYASFRDNATSRQRFNSGTDSNTSGVSSYESIYTKTLIGDLHQTLSPIPSTSNLSDTKKSSNELFRRTSLTGASFRETILSPQGVLGYAKLRSLRRHQRPMLSESAADELADIMMDNTRTQTLRSSSFTTASTLAATVKGSVGATGGASHGGGGGGQSTRLTIGHQQRKLKVRSLDRHSNIASIGVEDVNDSINPLEISEWIPTITDTNGPCYTGICLPKNICDLFPQEVRTGTYVSQYVQEMDTFEYNTNMKIPTQLQQQLADSNNECDGESCVSSLSDISVNSKRTKLINRHHNRGTCVICCRHKLNRCLYLNQQDNNGDDNTHFLNRRFINNRQPSTHHQQHHHHPHSHHPHHHPHPQSHHHHPQPPNAHHQLSSDISFNSPESVFSEDTGTGSISDRIALNILRHVERMSNPLWSKQSKMSLLEMKQKYPQSFQDICLYSDVCKLLSSSTYRLTVRRFLQELFFDLNFDQLYNEPSDIIVRKERDRETNSSIGSGDEEMFIFKDDSGGSGAAAATAAAAAAAAAAASSAGAGVLLYNNNTINSTYIDRANILQPNEVNMICPDKSSVLYQAAILKSFFANHSNPFTSQTLPQTQTPTPTTNPNTIIIPPPPPPLMKSHIIKSPPLASVYESSIENLSESLSKIGTITPNTNNNNNNKQITNHNSDTNKNSNTNDDNNNNNDSNNNNDNNKQSTIDDNSIQLRSQHSFRRPRFNTLELDLSCTKNKFPISQRRQQLNSPLTPTTAATTTARTMSMSFVDREYPSSMDCTKMLSSSVATTTPAMLPNSLFSERNLESSKSETTLMKSITKKS